MSISIITPTRDRQEQLSLVIDCINNQTLMPDEWIIVDDGSKPVDKNILDKIVIPHKYIHYKSYLSISTCMNSAKALQATSGDKIIFFDDDDYYPPKYIENFSKLLKNENEMIGNIVWTDYRLSTGYYRIRVKSSKQIREGDTMMEWHSSGIMGNDLKNLMIEVLTKNKTNGYNDCVCFNQIFKRGFFKCRHCDFMDWGSISLKDYGVGNKGTIKAHFSDDGLIRDDDNFSFFKKLLGEDWKRYEKYLGRLR